VAGIKNIITFGFGVRERVKLIDFQSMPERYYTYTAMAGEPAPQTAVRAGKRIGYAPLVVTGTASYVKEIHSMTSDNE